MQSWRSLRGCFLFIERGWAFSPTERCQNKETRKLPFGARMNSHEIARYIEATNGIAKPWLLLQLRLKKLQENQASMPPEAYAEALADIHQDLMNLGEWWHGIEDEVF